MTPEEIRSTEFYRKHLEGAKKVLAVIAESYFYDNATALSNKCESPLEAAFMAWWLAVVDSDPVGTFLADLQVPVVANGSSYRLDVVVRVHPTSTRYPGLATDHRAPRVAIELDGHEFHERTKEQVELRNRRDRDLQFEKWFVIHVSGSEFNRDPTRVMFGLYRDLRRLFDCEADSPTGNG